MTDLELPYADIHRNGIKIGSIMRLGPDRFLIVYQSTLYMKFVDMGGLDEHLYDCIRGFKYIPQIGRVLPGNENAFIVKAFQDTALDMMRGVRN